jgi:hypothetical protein
MTCYPIRFCEGLSQRFIKRWFLICVIAFILPLPSLKHSQHLLRFHYLKGCPHATPILDELQRWANQQSIWEVQLLEANAFLPSPTLRISQSEGFTNYIGTKAIKDALETNFFIFSFP